MITDSTYTLSLEKALLARASWQPGTRMDSWMYRIMRNAWIDTARARSRAAGSGDRTARLGHGVAHEAGPGWRRQTAAGEVAGIKHQQHGGSVVRRQRRHGQGASQAGQPGSQAHADCPHHIFPP